MEGTRLLHLIANLTHASERGRRFICTEARQTFLAKLRYGIRIANQSAVAWLSTLDPSLKCNCRTAASGPVRPINDSPPRAVCCCFHSSPIPCFLPSAANAVVVQVQPTILLKQRKINALAKRCLGVSTCCADHLFLAAIRPMLDRQAQERQQIFSHRRSLPLGSGRPQQKPPYWYPHRGSISARRVVRSSPRRQQKRLSHASPSVQTL